MEPVIENIYTGNVKMAAEKSRKIWNTGKTPMGWVYIALAVGMFAMAIWWQMRSYYFIFASILLCVGIYNLCSHWLWAMLDMRKAKQENGGTVFPSTITVSDEFSVSYKNEKMSFPVLALKEAYFLKYSILVRSVTGTFMTFRRDGFTKGSAEELEQFIREKCPQAAIIHNE